MKNSGFRSYPSGAGMGNVPTHQQPIVAVDANWVQMHGSRAQRRRVDRKLKRMAVAKK